MKSDKNIVNFIEYLNTIILNDRLTVKHYSERLTTVDIIIVNSTFSMLSLFITNTNIVSFETRKGESLDDSFSPPDRSFTDFEMAKNYVNEFISLYNEAG